MALGIRTFEQRIAAGSDFDGTLPTGEITRSNNIEAWPEDSAGGLFDTGLVEPLFVRSIELQIGGQSSWTIHKRDVDGSELMILQGSTEQSVITTLEDSFVLTAGQLLVVRTFGATNPLFCRVHFQAPV